MEISLCMIVKNEEDKLGACLDSVCDLVDEINIVDTGSTDNTVEIAKKYTERVFHFDWINDFSAARNFSFSKATKDYIMWLDADDIIESENREKFKKLKKQYFDNINCIRMYYNINHDSAGNVICVSQRERIIKRSAAHKWEGAVHEILKTDGNSALVDIYITHTDKDMQASMERNIEILERSALSANANIRDIYYYGSTLYQLGRHDEALIQLNRFISQNSSKSFTGTDAYICAYTIYMNNCDYENAYKILALNEMPNRHKSEYYCCLGNFMEDVLVDHEAAIVQYKKALNCTGTEADGKTFSQRLEEYYYFAPYHNIGRCFFKLNLFNEALDNFSKALEYRKNDANTKAIINKITKLIELS